MKAKVAENRARLVLAEADIPRAMADAFRQGNLQSGGAENVGAHRSLLLRSTGGLSLR